MKRRPIKKIVTFIEFPDGSLVPMSEDVAVFMANQPAHKGSRVLRYRLDAVIRTNVLGSTHPKADR